MYRLVRTGLILDHLGRFVIRPIIKYTDFWKFRKEWTGSVYLVQLQKNRTTDRENTINPYLLHFGNIQERHLWKKNPKFTFWSLMTSYMFDFLWRHINLKLHQLGYLYVTWPESRDVISGRYHVMKLITPENPGNE